MALKLKVPHRADFRVLIPFWSASRTYALIQNVSMYNQRQPDVEAEVTFLSSEAGGKTNAVKSGYRPVHQVLDNYLTTGNHEYVDRSEVWPGETVLAHIWFVTPEAYPACMWIDRTVRMQEGSRLVSHAKITKIFNKVLERTT